MEKYVVLVLIWIVYCVIHSAMISVSFVNYLRDKVGEGFKYYRLFYIFFSVVTIIPALYFSYSLEDEIFFKWDGYKRVFQIALLSVSLLILVSATKQYDMLEFLGLSHCKKPRSNPKEDEGERV